MNYNAVFHLDLNDTAILNVALSNIANYYTALENLGEEGKAEVVLLVNGPAVNLFKKDIVPHDFVPLQEKGLQIRLCQNALNKFSLSKDMLLDNIAIVPAGIVELVRLQNEQFSYIKP